MKDVGDADEVLQALRTKKFKGKKGKTLNVIRDTGKMRTTSQVLMNLNKKKFVLNLIPGKVDFVGVKDKMPKGRKHKISVDVTKEGPEKQSTTHGESREFVKTSSS